MPNISEMELKQKEAALKVQIEHALPDFARSCRDDNDLVLIHQDSFAADYQEDEYLLLGMAIKFAGLCGKEVRIIGKNGDTVKDPRRTEFLQ